jgi:hypothetical protein
MTWTLLSVTDMAQTEPGVRCILCKIPISEGLFFDLCLTPVENRITDAMGK